MRLKAALLVAGCFSGSVGATEALAQEVVFRRPVPVEVEGDYEWKTTPFEPVDGAGNPLDGALLCGEYPVQRSLQCMTSSGTIVPNSFCSSLPAPETSSNQNFTAGCSYAWQAGGWNDPGSSCSDSETQTRTVSCMRSDGQVVAASMCSGDAPENTQTVADYSACPAQTSVNWGPWKWSSTCSSTASRSRSGQCLVNGVASDAKFCETHGGKPLSESVSEANYSSCSYAGTYGDYGTCANGSHSASMISCRRVETGDSVSISYCTGSGQPATVSKSCAMTPGTGPVLDVRSRGGTGTHCLPDEDIDASRVSFPQWCRDLGGTYLQRRQQSCQPTQDPYDYPWEQSLTETCRAY